MHQKSLAFRVPFSGFATTTFINCFASVYVFLEGIDVSGDSDYACNMREGKPCNGCGHCGSTPTAKQERFFFLFDTMCGHSSLRCRFDDQPTEMERWICETDFYDGGADSTVEFLFSFAGYDYQKLTDPASFESAVIQSIDAGRPVLAKGREKEGRFHVLTGYDGHALISPDYADAQRRPDGTPAYDDLEALYLIGDKMPPKYALKDGLLRIQKVMEYNQREKLWDDYMEKIGLYTADGLRNADLEERKRRMKRVADTMWHTFNTHNFAEVFRQRQYTPLQNPIFDPFCRDIGGPCYGYTHDLAWALIGLEEKADWTAHYAGYFGEMVQLTLRQIAKNDDAVLDIVGQMIALIP